MAGIMCHEQCGSTIHSLLTCFLQDCKDKKWLPEDAELIIDAEPMSLGVHRLLVKVVIETKTDSLDDSLKNKIASELRESIGFEVLDNMDESPKKSNKVNWINILVNLVSIIAIITLSVVFPPSIPLTIGLAALSFVTTAFTARHYLINFVRNLRNKDMANMTTTISLGWFLSLAHTVYHSVIMPLASSFSMIFMSFIMPVLLITVVNGMDEIKRLVLSKSKKMQLQGMKTLFPQMAEEYPCYQLSQEEIEALTNKIPELKNAQQASTDETLQQLLKRALEQENKSVLKQGMLFQVKRGQCFPVDCLLIEGNTLVDASLLNGEPRQNVHCLDPIPAGAINLGQSVSVYAVNDAYNSTVNRLLFKANRERKTTSPESTAKFNYFYTAIIVLGLIASIATPLALGLFTIPLLLQNVTGILFEICPCTMAIAHQLPQLMSVYQRGNKGVLLRDDGLSGASDEIHTVVFDKTGTLTTGNSQVESSDGISPFVWERVYLLEKEYGAQHPLAEAIIRYHEGRNSPASIIKDIKDVQPDSKNRGLSGIVQGRLIHIGNDDFLLDAGIELPTIDSTKLAMGFSPVYVAQDNVYQGVIYIKHEVRKQMLASLIRLKNEGKKIIMLTGDKELSATGFNQQNGGLFAKEDIHADQTPELKEEFLKHLMLTEGIDPKGVWFVGDGLNDAPCARVVSENGGVSCAITSDDKASFFSDISLNGTVDYLFEHNKINQFVKKNVRQNQGLLITGALAFLAFIITFSVLGIAVPPLIPLLIMASVTLLVLFNSYRVQFSIDNALDKKPSSLKRFLASDWSVVLLIAASCMLITGLLLATVATGGLAFPAMVFTAGVVAATSSACVVGAGGLFGLFLVLAGSNALVDRCDGEPTEERPTLPNVPAPRPSRLPIDHKPLTEDLTQDPVLHCANTATLSTRFREPIF